MALLLLLLLLWSVCLLPCSCWGLLGLLYCWAPLLLLLGWRGRGWLSIRRCRLLLLLLLEPDGCVALLPVRCESMHAAQRPAAAADCCWAG